jgi:hypothetical protein
MRITIACEWAGSIARWLLTVQSDRNDITFDSYFVFVDADARILHQRARLDLIRPPVPRASHDVVVDLALAERPCLVQAEIIDGMEVITQAEQGNMAAVDDHHLALAGYEIADVPDDDKVRQITCVPPA